MTEPTNPTVTRRKPWPAIDRRRFMAAGAALGSLVLLPGNSTSAARAAYVLHARKGKNPITGAPAPLLETDGGFGPLVLAAGGSQSITLSNQLAMPLVGAIRGADGLDARSLSRALTPGATDRIAFGARRPGTYLLQLAPEIRTETSSPSAGLALPLIVRAPIASATLADETLMVEEWPVASNTGADAPDATPLTANRMRTARIAASAGGALRLRLVNACAWRPVALLLPDMPATVIAIDSAPAEPFAPHARQLTLAPGGRIDVHLDLSDEPGGVHPILLHDGKAARRIAEIVLAKPNGSAAARAPIAVDPDAEVGLVGPRLEGALRVDLAAPRSASGPWRSAPGPADAPPAFSLRAGRTASLALSHAFAVAATFRIEGHHARLLDRLDDGWKPFWLDTILVPAGETARIALAAPIPGRWRIACIPAAPDSRPLYAAFEVV